MVSPIRASYFKRSCNLPSSPRRTVDRLTPKTRHALTRVLMVIARPASTCCQCRAEKPNPIISSWVKLCRIRCFRRRLPSSLKNGAKSRSSDCRDKTPSRGTRHEQLHHEQNS
jgi:hypothetical protein